MIHSHMSRYTGKIWMCFFVALFLLSITLMIRMVFFILLTKNIEEYSLMPRDVVSLYTACTAYVGTCVQFRAQENKFKNKLWHLRDISNSILKNHSIYWDQECLFACVWSLVIFVLQGESWGAYGWQRMLYLLCGFLKKISSNTTRKTHLRLLLEKYHSIIDMFQSHKLLHNLALLLIST